MSCKSSGCSLELTNDGDEMNTTTKLRMFGAAILLFNLWLIGNYNLEGWPVLALTLGFALGYEFLVVRTIAGKDE